MPKAPRRVQFPCPNTGKLYHFEASPTVRSFKCPCGHRHKIPAASPPDSDRILSALVEEAGREPPPGKPKTLLKVPKRQKAQKRTSPLHLIGQTLQVLAVVYAVLHSFLLAHELFGWWAVAANVFFCPISAWAAPVVTLFLKGDPRTLLIVHGVLLAGRMARDFAEKNPQRA